MTYSADAQVHFMQAEAGQLVIMRTRVTVLQILEMIVRSEIAVILRFTSIKEIDSIDDTFVFRVELREVNV